MSDSNRCPYGISGCTVGCCPKKQPAIFCTRLAGHGGPCNGFPRLDEGIHCYTLRLPPVPSPEPESWGFTSTNLKECLGQAQRRIADLEAENIRLQTRINDLISITASGH